jgi:acetyltransferase-like isoleucine patch superfamily enzyme
MAMTDEEIKAAFLRIMQNVDNPFHPLVWINGSPRIGAGTRIGGMSEVYANGAQITIGAHCDIASFVVINVADSHLRVLGLSTDFARRDIVIGEHVFIGSHCAILGGSEIGHYCVIAAGTVLRGEKVPPYSLVIGNPAVIKPGYYEARINNAKQRLKA